MIVNESDGVDPVSYTHLDVYKRQDDRCTEPKIIIVTKEINDEINALVRKLSDDQPKMIAGFREDTVKVLEPNDIYRVYASGGKVFAETRCV